MDLIDAAGDTPGAEDDDEEEDDELAAQRPGVGPLKAESGQEPAPRSQGQGPGPGTGSGDTYRPKRPTTLNLFPQVPRSQVRRKPSGGELRGRRIGWTGKMEGREPAGEAREPRRAVPGEGQVFCREGQRKTRG